MIKQTLAILGCAVLALGFTSATKAEEDKEKPGVHATEMYSFATAESQKNGAVFGTIENTTDENVVFKSASSDVAEVVELHTHITENGVMKMREVESYEIPAGEKFTLRPMSYHIMLLGLKEPLQEGQSFEVELTKNNGDTMPIKVRVVAPGITNDDNEAMEHSMDSGMDHEKEEHEDASKNSENNKDNHDH